MIVHQGRAEQGHYTYFLKRADDWLKFDDSRVSMETRTVFEEECFGNGSIVDPDMGEFGETSRNAYVLIYERKHKQLSPFISAAEPLPHLMLEEVLQDNHSHLV